MIMNTTTISLVYSFCITLDWWQLSYILVDLLIWWGVRGCINDLRRNKLRLAPVAAYFNTYHVSISHLPTTYMWSSHLVAKPNGTKCYIYVFNLIIVQNYLVLNWLVYLQIGAVLLILLVTASWILNPTTNRLKKLSSG